MALTDIDFNEGEGGDFIMERPVGTLNAPLDIVTETSGSQFLVLETPLIASGNGDGDIFIMND